MGNRLRMIRSAFSILATSTLLAGPANAFELAQDLTCDQAIAYYDQNHVIYVLSHDIIALPIRVGVPIGDAAKLQCSDRGQVPHGYTVKTKDRWRCIIAQTC